MKKLIVILLVANFTKSGLAQIPQQKVESKIENVTVFINNAQVERGATATLPKGKSELIFKGLTPNLDAQSVTVKGEGDFTIMSVKPQMNFLEEIKKKDTIFILENERERFATRTLKLKAELDILEKQEDILSRNRVQILGLLNSPNKVEDLKALVEFQKISFSEILMRRLELQAEEVKINRELSKITLKLTDLNAPKTTTTAEIVVTVFAKNAAFPNAKFRLEYIVPNCGWQPYYDLRVKDVTAPITAQMKAKVRQNTGEDWKEVRLTLSTGEPKKGGVKPELGTWLLDNYGQSFYQGRVISVLDDYKKQTQAAVQNRLQGIITDEQGEPLVGASIVIKNSNIGTVSDINGRYSMDLSSNNKNSNLIFSFVGYENQEISIGNNSFINTQLSPNTHELQEVVVTGYGGSRRQDILDPLNEKREQPITAQQLQGRVAGVSIGSTSNFRIRGSNSIKSNDGKSEFNFDFKETAKLTTSSYEIELPYTILTDGKEHQVEVKEENIKAEYQYTCAPKLETDAFLTANVVDWEQYNLLEGEANLYFEGTYLGKTLLKTDAVDDTLKLSLGRDKNVVVTRTKLKEFSKSSVFSSKKKESRSFEIKIKNKKGIPLSISIEDQIPVATDKDIAVEFEAKGAEYDKNKGRLTWKIEIKPFEDKKLFFNYSVKHADGVRVSLD